MVIEVARPQKYKTEEERLEARRKSQREWAKKNKETVAYIRSKSFAKQFIEMSEDEDIEILEQWIKERKQVKMDE